MGFDSSNRRPLVVGDKIGKEYYKKAEAFQAHLDQHKGKVKAFLLGPGYPEGEYNARHSLCEELKDEGYAVFIMEELRSIKSVEIHDKFNDILDEISPELIICIFTREGAPHAVIFEVGFLCGKYGFDWVFSRLKFCLHNDLCKKEVLPRYFNGLIARAETYDYYDDDSGRMLIDRVKKIIENETVRLYSPPNCAK